MIAGVFTGGLMRELETGVQMGLKCGGMRYGSGQGGNRLRERQTVTVTYTLTT